MKSDRQKLQDEYQLAKAKSQVLAKYDTPEALFDYLFGTMGQLSKKQLKKRLVLTAELSKDFAFTFSKILDEDLLDHRLIETGTYLQDGLPAFRSTIQFKTNVCVDNRLYDVWWTLTPSFAKKEGSYYRMPLPVHQHERLLVDVLSVTDHRNPIIKVDKQYHREDRSVTMRMNDYYQRYLAPDTWHKLGFFDKHWTWDMTIWQLWLTQQTNDILDEELNKLKWLKPVAVRRAYLRVLKLVQNGAMRYDLNSPDLKQFVKVNGRVAFINEPDAIYDEVVKVGLQSKDFQDYVMAYQDDLDYLLGHVFGYNKIDWEEVKLTNNRKK